MIRALPPTWHAFQPLNFSPIADVLIAGPPWKNQIKRMIDRAVGRCARCTSRGPAEAHAEELNLEMKKRS
jgi:hypothetical protein